MAQPTEGRDNAADDGNVVQRNSGQSSLRSVGRMNRIPVTRNRTPSSKRASVRQPGSYHATATIKILS